MLASTSSVSHPLSPNDTAPVAVLVGGAGFIGQYVARLLAREGYRLKIISRNPNASLEVKTVGDLGQTVLLQGNLSKPETITRHFAGAHAVINLVGILQERGKQRFNTLQAKGAEALAKAAREQGVKQFIQFSALGVDKANASAYARSKLRGENAVLASFPHAVILRPSVVFGPEDGFYNRFAAMAMISPLLPAVGGGRTKYQPVYVGDVAKAVLAALRDPQGTARNIYELGGPEVYTLRQVIDYINRTTGRNRWIAPMSFGFAGMSARILQFFPYPFTLTPDQVTLLQYDNVVQPGAKGLSDLGIQAEAVEMVAPAYLARFRRKPAALSHA